MPDYIEWYLVELEQAASKTLSKEEVTDIQQEVRAHLTESAASFESEGVTAEDAAKRAVKEMGSVHDLFDRGSTNRWTIFWYAQSFIPLYVLAMELAENGVVAVYSFGLLLLVVVMMVVISYKARRIQAIPLLCVPVAVFVFTALFLPAWFIDLGDLDGYGIVSRFDLNMGLYEGGDLSEINTANNGYSYWQQFGAFIPSAVISSVWLFGITGCMHLSGVYIRRISEWRMSRRQRASFH